jgi:predicted ribosomally synthesized peptide with nif11-like leader
MSLDNVKSFYARLTSDEAFRSQIQNVNSKDECSQIVREAGYEFTQEELEEYTSQLLESTSDGGEIRDLNQKELEAVFGGLGGGVVQPLYGVIVWPPQPWPPIQPLYGVVQ